MAKLSTYTALTGANFATGDKFVLVDASAGTAGTVTATMAEMVKGLPRLGFNPPTTGIMAINGTTQWNWDDGAVFPETDDDVDLGKTAQRWKDIYIDGVAYLDAINLTGTAVTATAAEINYLDISSLGTGAASKAVVLDSGDDYTWPAAGILTYGVLKDPAGTTITATGAEINYLDIAVLGTGAASKAVVLDSGDDYTWPAAGILTYGVLKDPAGTSLAATALELNRTCDVSARIVAVGGTSLAVTVAAHDGKIITLDHTAAESTATLPAAAGTGAVVRFLVSAVNTNNHIVAANGTDVLKGVVMMVDDDSNAATAYSAKSTDDKITLNGTTTGGQIGDWLEFVDIAAGSWTVKGALVVPAGQDVADPFAAS